MTLICLFVTMIASGTTPPKNLTKEKRYHPPSGKAKQNISATWFGARWFEIPEIPLLVVWTDISYS